MCVCVCVIFTVIRTTIENNMNKKSTEVLQ